MENNKILIGAQFTDFDGSRNKTFQFELIALRDITFSDLLEAVKYGLKKFIKEDSSNSSSYEFCYDVYNKCIGQFGNNQRGAYYSNVYISSYDEKATTDECVYKDRSSVYVSAKNKPICDLGFITSTKLIFDATGSLKIQGNLDTDHVINAFRPEVSNETSFPKYNISTRQLYKFDTTPVEIIDPPEPPKKNKTGLMGMLLVPLLSVFILVSVRLAISSFSSNGMGSGITMLVFSLSAGMVSVVATLVNYNKQKKEYKQDLINWKEDYQTYINDLMREIDKRQRIDNDKLNELYPDMLTLINEDENGVYSLKDTLYSRSINDEDFASFRLGRSMEVPSKFDIKGEDRSVISSEAAFDIETDSTGKDKVTLYLREEEETPRKRNKRGSYDICKLPNIVSERYKYLNSAPLVYSIKNKRALGIVSDDSPNLAPYVINRMIFELCYYHSPEDLQFVVFFKNTKDMSLIENKIAMYKFLPHFKGLFDDKSQFAFDDYSAKLILDSLLNIMNLRKNSSDSVKRPHIVFLIYDEFDLKEHPFANFLPEPPVGDSVVDNMGLTFIFSKEFKEHLPAYCDDIITIEKNKLSLCPRIDENKNQSFYLENKGNEITPEFYKEFTKRLFYAQRFLSSVYYDKIAQNGKVPSNVSMLKSFGITKDQLESKTLENWGLQGTSKLPSVTKSLAVPIGFTDKGYEYLDLHEKADGPHMLVAGTTGSGKSESIITFLIGLCYQYRPDELNLLLVDMKGGGFTKRLGSLPHVVGTVTDVDGDENGSGSEYMLRRFLSALSSEITRRKIKFNAMGVDSIDAYIKACKNIEAHISHKNIKGEKADELRRMAKNEKLSHLFLVVDEFTELKRFSSNSNDVDFIAEITTIARVGRSLGLHIILISQNIEGAINDDIRVNCRSKLCLKVATKQASKEMLGNECAASPSMPGNGRGYLLVGSGARFDYFQTGYSGADLNEAVPLKVTLASKTGANRTFYDSEVDNEELINRRKEEKAKGLTKNQLELVVETITKTYEAHKSEISIPHIVFRPPLPKNLVWDGSKPVEVHITKEVK